MGTVAWTRGGSPLAPFAQGYRAELAGLGYTLGSVKQHIVLMGQLSRWMSSERLVVEHLTSARAEEFLASRRAAGQQRVPTQRSLRVLFDFLEAQGVISSPPVTTPTETEELLERYGRYLAVQRGLTPLTVKRYRRMAAVPGGAFVTAGRLRRTDVAAGEVLGSLLRDCSRLAVAVRRSDRQPTCGRCCGSCISKASPRPISVWRSRRSPGGATRRCRRPCRRRTSLRCWAAASGTSPTAFVTSPS